MHFILRSTLLLPAFSLACAAFRGWTAPLGAVKGSRGHQHVFAAAADAPSCPSANDVLGENQVLLSESQTALVGTLLKLSQEHLFADWPPLGSDDDKKVSLVEQLAATNAAYPGGLEAYVLKARRLLADSAAGTNPFEGYTPSVPSGEDLLYGDEEYRGMEALGAEGAAKLGFVLVAGGLGERLGYSGIKVELPVELATGKPFLHMYAEWLLALQARCRTTTGDANLLVPLAIMTSGDTDAPTRTLLVKNNYFGLDPKQVTVLMQDKVPALNDSEGRMVTKGPWKLETKPHGHGDVHHLLQRSGLAKKWAAAGKEWVFFFQDTNPLVVHALVPMLGVSVDRSYDMNSLCVPRRAGEAAGAITKLVHTDGHEITINVEYNQLDPLLRATPGFESGDVDDPQTLFSPFPGNVNNLLVYLPSYAKAVAGPDQGVVEEFVNPKYADATRTAFKKPTRLECMMQDLPKLLAKELKGAAKVGFTTMERWLTFSPAKNDPESGAAAAAKGAPPGSPASSEADFYAAYRATLAKATGCAVAAGDEQTFAGMPVQLQPAVVLEPSFATTSTELGERFNGQGASISGRSSLVVGGDVAVGAGLALDGALVLRAAPGASLRVEAGLEVTNQGWEFVAVDTADAAVPEVLRIRGFDLVKHETKTVEVASGKWVLRKNGTLEKDGT